MPNEAPEFVHGMTAPNESGLRSMAALPLEETSLLGINSDVLPVWDPSVCIDCGLCSASCPHDAISMKVFTPDALVGAPPTFQSKKFRAPDRPGRHFAIQVAPDSCTGCGICVDVCPTHDSSLVGERSLNLLPARDHRDWQRANFSFSQTIPQVTLDVAAPETGFGPPDGWGKSSYLELLDRLFGDRLAIVNASGCSSIALPAMVGKAVWIVGGNGWPYDRGVGDLDQMLIPDRNVNVLVLDADGTAPGKVNGKLDLGSIARAFGTVYVAQVAIGANHAQTVKAFVEAAAWRGPSLIIAYSARVAHGVDVVTSLKHQKDAVESGYWPLYRFQPDAHADGHPFHLDSTKPTDLVAPHPLMSVAQTEVDERWGYYEQLSYMERPAAQQEATSSTTDGTHS
jgi:pyruvate/2-oxoacid:ferredoxin oxidoreductase beta subunit/ferredoxin